MAEKTSEGGGVGWFSVANFALTILGGVMVVMGDQVWQNSITVRGLEQKVADLETRVDRQVSELRREDELRHGPMNQRLDSITARITAETSALKTTAEARNAEQDGAATRAAAGYLHEFDRLASRIDRVEARMDAARREIQEGGKK